MYSKRNVWLLIIGLVALCGMLIGGIAWYRVDRSGRLAHMMRRLPQKDAVVLYIDAAALRNAGVMQFLLSGNVPEEPDYRDFVAKTEFDYRTDLDAALVSFNSEGMFMVGKGRFDWRSLRKYAVSQGGDCYNVTCRMTGSTASRNISFFSIERSLLGLAVGPDQLAVERLKEVGPVEMATPPYPLWVKIPTSVLKTSEKFPAGTKMLARSMGESEGITLGLAQEGKQFALKLDAACRSEEAAATLASDLNRITMMVRDMIARENQKPNAADLSGVLTSGKFEHQGSRVNGGWVVEWSFLKNLVSGGS